METYDFLVIGGGPGGYVAAIRAAQLGMKVACVEKWPAPGRKGVVLGGTCLNVGCIPSKALLESSHRYEDAEQHFAAHGVDVPEVRLDLMRMHARKDKIVDELTGGIAMLLKKNKVSVLAGAGRIKSVGQVCEIEVGASPPVGAKNLVIATGSVARGIPAAPLDGDRVVDNIGALCFPKVPARLCVIGAGVIGLELGSVWRRLGSEVVILEALPDFLAAADCDIAAAALKILRKQKLDIRLGCMVTSSTSAAGGVTVTWKGEGGEESGEFDRLVVAVGRAPFTEGLGAAEAGLEMDSAGRLVVDDLCRTAHANVFAIGDVVRGPMLAHKAEDEGVMVAELVAGQKPELDYACIPWVIYTHPEIAWVGATEQQLKAAGRNYAKGSFPFAANGRAKGMGATAGMVKILTDKDTDRLLGAHILGVNASDLIGETVLAMEFGASAEDIARTCHAHPTLSEAVKEASLAVSGRALHS